jgi:hypothetical protein
MRIETLDRLVAVGFDPDVLDQPGGYWRDRAEHAEGRLR